MTALDQAFIKAFSQHTVPVAPVASRPATPAVERASSSKEPRAEEKLPTVNGVLAVLERPVKKAVRAPKELKEEHRAEPPRPNVAAEPAGRPWAVSSEQVVVGPEQWTMGNEQWAVGDESWAADTSRSAVCVEPCCPTAEPEISKTNDAKPCVTPAKSHFEIRESPVDSCFSEHEGEAADDAPPDASASDDPACTIPLYPNNGSAAQLFQPAWQVDHFTWPRVCRRLMARAAEELDRLADALSAANVQGQRVLGMAGYRRGEGATTLLLCAARRLAERGIKLALIDADLTRPRLAKRLGVQPQFGWDEVAANEEASLARAIVEAAANNLALLPLREPSEEAGRCDRDPSRLARCVEILRSRYDMVLVNMGPLEESGRIGGIADWTAAGTIDAVVLAHDQRITTEDELFKVEGQLAVAGIAAVGIVENFAAED